MRAKFLCFSFAVLTITSVCNAQSIANLRLAAKQGDAVAQFNLGVAYDYGKDVPQDHAQAVNWYRKAAVQGLASAQYNLGLAYDYGEGVPQDHVQAVNWYRKAAEQGDASA
jgi:TPR repeat protein